MKLSSFIRDGKSRQTLFFFLTGYILTGVWMFFQASDLCYLRSDGVWRSFSRDAILWSGFFAVITGFLPPLVCFPLKFYSWKLAWGALTTLFLIPMKAVVKFINYPAIRRKFRQLWRRFFQMKHLARVSTLDFYRTGCCRKFQ